MFAVKRLIGRRFDDPMSARTSTWCPTRSCTADNGDAWVEVRGEKKAPAQISAEILKKMKADGRALSRRAGRARPSSPSRPTSTTASARRPRTPARSPASTSCASSTSRPRRRSPTASTRGQNQTIAVYDLGGGTFDVSILEIGDGVFEVKSTNGDTFLGGEDFDQRMIDYLADEFKKEHRHRPAQRPAGPAAPEGGGREGQDRALVDDADRGQPAVHHRRRSRARST